MLTQLAVAPINHVLRGESWALRRLAPFAGRTARFDVLPFSALVTVRDSGEIAAAASGAAADVHIRLTPAAAARILAGDQAAYDEVAVDGDDEFAQALQFVVRNARWDVEEDLSRVVGDTLAHRAVGAGRAVLQLQARAAASLARNLSDYWLEERPLIARRADVVNWVHEVDLLRDDVERLAQRIARL
ncbi:MAG: ubiquinone biosynthesis accessory factor UbiJ [Burkholderiales bacterium]